jgi:hypothetical protein
MGTTERKRAQHRAFIVSDLGATEALPGVLALVRLRLEASRPYFLPVVAILMLEEDAKLVWTTRQPATVRLANTT